MALEAFLRRGEHTRRKPAGRVRGLTGSLHSGVPDLAERHRQYVIKALNRAAELLLDTGAPPERR